MNDFLVRSGVRTMVLASILSAAAGALFFSAHLMEPAISSLGGTYVRIWMNVVLILFIFYRRKNPLMTWPKNQGLLWVWGVFGVLTVTTYFAAIGRVGAGQASLLNASFGIFAVALSPWVLSRPIPQTSWILVAGASIGLWLLMPSNFIGNAKWGTLLALSSGFFAGAAYLAVAKAGARHSPLVVQIFWTAVCLPLCTVAIFYLDPTWPQHFTTYGIWIAAGLFAAASQYCMAVAYQLGPIDDVSAATYIAPALSMGIDYGYFQKNFNRSELCGVALILIVGVGGPFMRAVWERKRIAIKVESGCYRS